MAEGLVFYRCTLCHRIVTPWDVKDGTGCRHCGGARIQPTNLTMWEKVQIVWRHRKQIWSGEWESMEKNNPATEA